MVEHLEEYVQLSLIKDLPGILLLSSESFLREMYLEKGLSAAQIAAQIVSSKSGVLDALRRFDIPIREPHRPHHGRQSQPKFGQRRVKGRLRNHERERTVIGVIEKLHAEGMSLRQIATTLQEMGIPTKCKGRRWHPEMVRRVLEK